MPTRIARLDAGVRQCSTMASDCAGPPLAGRANVYKHFPAHCGAQACDCGRRIFILVRVRQDRAVRMVNNGLCGARRGAERPETCYLLCPTVAPGGLPIAVGSRCALPASGGPAQLQASSPSQVSGDHTVVHGLLYGVMTLVWVAGENLSTVGLGSRLREGGKSRLGRDGPLHVNGNGHVQGGSLNQESHKL
jgi:hypothetical protein